MNNFITLFLNVLVQLGHLTKAEAEKLNTEFQGSTLHDGFEASYHMVEGVFEKVGIDKRTSSLK